MEKQEKTYEFLYDTYQWPAPGTERTCPISGTPLELTGQRPGFNGKPWTCPKCMWFFSEEELANPGQLKGLDPSPVPA